MTEKKSRYIDPLTDYGFKRLFGSEPDKDIMIEFLNALFEGEKIVIDIRYSPTDVEYLTSFRGKRSDEKTLELCKTISNPIQPIEDHG